MKYAVYGVDENDEMFRIEGGLTEQEAKDKADKHYNDTGRTAVMVRALLPFQICQNNFVLGFSCRGFRL